MSTAFVADPVVETPPLVKARIAGLFYLLTFLTGVVAFVADSALLVANDAAATATRIAAHEARFRVGVAFWVLNIVCYLVVTLLFYDLFRPVRRSIALLAAYFSLVACAIQASACLFQLGTLVILGHPAYLAAFSVPQLQALAMLCLRLHGQAYNIGLVFFGVYCFLIGWLAYRSRFLPAFVGALMMVGGIGWMTFLYSPLADAVRPANLLLGVLGEGSLTLWLLIRGVNEERSKERRAIEP